MIWANKNLTTTQKAYILHTCFEKSEQKEFLSYGQTSEKSC